MRVSDFAPIRESRLISFVGAGGKTSTMFELAKNLKNLGKRVLVSTTTSIFYPEKHQYDRLLFLKDFSLRQDLMNALVVSDASITILARDIHANNNRKIHGVDCNLINELDRSYLFDVILLEADGSKRLPIKAPADHEPVIPSQSDLVVGIVGFSSLGKYINEDNVHRPELFAKLANDKLGAIISEEMIAKLVVNKDGLFRGVSASAKKIFFLNQVDQSDKNNVLKAKQIIKEVHANDESIGCFFGAIIDQPGNLCGAIANKQINMTAILMASGASKRFGENKLLAMIGEKPMMSHVIDLIQELNFKESFLIYQDEQIKGLAGSGIQCIYNPNAHEGMSASLKLGIISSTMQTDAFVFFNGDVPFFTSNDFKTMHNVFESNTNAIVVPRYNGQNGTPTIFSSKWKDQLLKVSGDNGGRHIIRDNPDDVIYVDLSANTIKDVDTRSDLYDLSEVLIEK